MGQTMSSESSLNVNAVVDFASYLMVYWLCKGHEHRS